MLEFRMAIQNYFSQAQSINIHTSVEVSFQLTCF